MNCLVVAATVIEITPFLEQYRAKEVMPAGIEIDVLVEKTSIVVRTNTGSLAEGDLVYISPEIGQVWYL